MDTSEEIARLREGAMIDYNMQTWEVTAHDTYDDARWPSDVWTLRSGADVRFLEHDYDGTDVFRLFEAADITDVTVEGVPFVSAVRNRETAPDTVTYQDTEYVLVEENARIDEPPGLLTEELTRSEDDWKLTGVCGGIAEYVEVPSSLVRVGFVLGTFATNFVFPCLLMPLGIALYVALVFAIPKVDHSTPERKLSNYWVYKKDDQFVVCERGEDDGWDVYVGRTVEPYEFSNLLPGGSST